MKMYNNTQAAKFLGYSRQTILQWRLSGIFPPPDQQEGKRFMLWSEDTLRKFKETL